MINAHDSFSVRASNIGNMKVKWITVKGRVEIFRMKLQGKIVVGSRKILPDLDREQRSRMGNGSMNSLVHRA